MTKSKLPFQKPSRFKKIVTKIIRKLRLILDVSIDYRYAQFSIKLPANHLLPEYQKTHPKYDRFLPHLAKHIVQPATIIDIGANVGDTLAGMAEKNSTATYICIEPDDTFFDLLEKNVETIKALIPGLRVKTLKALVGKKISNVSLEGWGGTKHSVIGGDGVIKSSLLDELISDSDHIRVIKSDVDGFDYDVLDSSMAVIHSHKPMIFFECQYGDEQQKNGYCQTLKSLESAGYCDWTVFDNFGEVVIRTHDFQIITQLMEYVWKQNKGYSTRTIFYFDVLAVQKGDSSLIDQVLKEY
jgi:FkbM family methyltransferase